MSTTKLDLLRRNELLSGMTDAELEQLLSLCAMAKLKAGTTLVTQGEPPRGMFLLASGRADVLVETEQGEPLKLHTAQAGEALGELSLIDGKPASATVRTATEAVVYRLDRKGLQRLREQQHPVAYTLLRRLAAVVCKRLRDITDRTRRGARGIAQDSLPTSAGLDRGPLTPAQRQAVAQQRHFRGLSPAELAPVLDVMRAVELPTGALVFREGEPGWACYLVLSGGIEVLFEREGRLEGLVTLRRGTLFGQVAVFDGGRRSATCRASEPTLLAELRRPHFDALLDSRSPGAWRLLEALLTVLTGQLRRATEQLRKLEELDRKRATSRPDTRRPPARPLGMQAFLRRARAGLGDFDLDDVEVVNPER